MKLNTFTLYIPLLHYSCHILHLFYEKISGSLRVILLGNPILHTQQYLPSESASRYRHWTRQLVISNLTNALFRKC